jgi:hypothetical protein
VLNVCDLRRCSFKAHLRERLRQSSILSILKSRNTFPNMSFCHSGYTRSHTLP